MTPARRNNQTWLPSIFNDFFDNDWVMKANTTAPAVNVIEGPEQYKIEVAAPGLTKDDFSIKLNDDGELLISMEKKNEKKEDPKHTYLRREFCYSKFEQSLLVPDDVDKDKIEANVKDGVLTVVLPKRSPEQQEKNKRVIEVK